MEEKNKALENLKRLIMKGYLERKVKIDDVEFTLRTLTMQEELNVLEESGVNEPPSINTKDLLKFMPVLLSYAIFKINGETITNKKEVEELLKNSTNPILIPTLYAEYIKLQEERMAAGDQLKNS